MIRPNNFDNVQPFRGFTPIEPGGHILIIKNVKETLSTNTKKPMLVVSFDTHTTDTQPSYFQETFDNDNRVGKKWPVSGQMNVMVFDSNGNPSRGLATLIDVVKSSNPGWEVQWDKEGEQQGKFVACFVNKLIGGVFGREEYQNSYGENRFSTKCQMFTTVERVKAGIAAPKDKRLSGQSNSSDGLIQVYDGGNMPF